MSDQVNEAKAAKEAAEDAQAGTEAAESAVEGYASAAATAKEAAETAHPLRSNIQCGVQQGRVCGLRPAMRSGLPEQLPLRGYNS